MEWRTGTVEMSQCMPQFNIVFTSLIQYSCSSHYDVVKLQAVTHNINWSGLRFSTEAKDKNRLYIGDIMSVLSAFSSLSVGWHCVIGRNITTALHTYCIEVILYPSNSSQLFMFFLTSTYQCVSDSAGLSLTRFIYLLTFRAWSS